MKSMVLTGIREMEMREVPTPAITQPTEVLVKLKTVAVCGSDVHYYVSGKIGSQVVEYPFAVGHECSGVVAQVGTEVTHCKVGDRVAIEPAIACGACDQCRVGRPHTCRYMRFLGCPGQAEGSLSEYIVMPHQCCLPIADSMSFDQAAISEPLAIGVYAVRQAGALAGLDLGILGYGPIGMSVMIPALAQGAGNIFVSDKNDARLAIARELGAAYAGNVDQEDIEANILAQASAGLDVVFECCGQQEALDNAFNLLKPGGKLIIVGIPEFESWSLSADIGRRKELSIINIRRQNGTVEETLAGLADGSFDVSKMPTHRFSFADTKAAFDLVAGYHDGVMKAMIDFD